MKKQQIKSTLLISLVAMSTISSSHDLLTEALDDGTGTFGFASGAISLSKTDILSIYQELYNHSAMIQFIAESDVINTTNIPPNQTMLKIPNCDDNTYTDKDHGGCDNSDFGHDNRKLFSIDHVLMARVSALETCEGLQETFPPGTFDSDLIPYYLAPSTLVDFNIFGLPTMSLHHHENYDIIQGVVFKCAYKLAVPIE
jgi:hypothetical protein